MKKNRRKELKNDLFLGISILISVFLLRIQYIKNNQDILCNEGSAWGIIENQLLLKVVTIILITVVIRVYVKEKNKVLRFGWLMIFLGGFSNLLERIIYNCVIDYWKVFSWWPMFNLADVLITFGVFLIVINFSRKIEEE